jgi:hypothetical protein
LRDLRSLTAACAGRFDDFVAQAYHSSSVAFFAEVQREGSAFWHPFLPDCVLKSELMQQWRAYAASQLPRSLENGESHSETEAAGQKAKFSTLDA